MYVHACTCYFRDETNNLILTSTTLSKSPPSWNKRIDIDVLSDDETKEITVKRERGGGLFLILFLFLGLYRKKAVTFS